MYLIVKDMGPEDEEMARQCSDYLNYIFYKENDGFLALYTAFKDALIQKNGILKVYWDDAQKIEREEYSRLTDDEFNDLGFYGSELKLKIILSMKKKLQMHLVKK